MSKKQLARVRRFCSALPETSERLSHGEPTFFVRNKVFVMFANNHHGDGHIAVWLPAPAGVQLGLIESTPKTYFNPPYVGVRGWVGIELGRISDADLSFHIQMAWELVAPKRLLSKVGATVVSPKPAPTRRASRSARKMPRVRRGVRERLADQPRRTRPRRASSASPNETPPTPPMAATALRTSRVQPVPIRSRSPAST